MATYYASLVGPLLGLYFPLPPELETEVQRRLGLITSGLKLKWCGIYPEQDTRDMVDRFGGVILPDHFAKQLDYDHFEVFDSPITTKG